MKSKTSNQRFGSEDPATLQEPAVELHFLLKCVTSIASISHDCSTYPRYWASHDLYVDSSIKSSTTPAILGPTFSMLSNPLRPIGR